jgi:hypothetical protein
MIKKGNSTTTHSKWIVLLAMHLSATDAADAHDEKDGTCTIIGNNIAITSADTFFVPSGNFSAGTCCDLCAAYPGCGSFTLNASGCALKGTGDQPPVKVADGVISGVNHDPKPGSPCTGGFKYGAGKCWLMLGGLKSLANWSNAKDDCSSKHADLAEIHSEAENDFVTEYVGGWCAIAWMGATCQGGDFHWTTTGNKVTSGWTNFAQSKVANCTTGTALNFNGKCSKGLDGKWSKDKDSQKLGTVVCFYQPQYK